MSIDFDCKFGLGYSVIESDLINEEDIEDGLFEYLCNNLSEGFTAWESGNSFTGDIDGTFIFVDNPLKDGLDLKEIKNKIDIELIRIKVEKNNEFGICGGGMIY